MKRFALVPISFVVLGLASCSTMKSGVDKFARAFHIIEHVEVKEVPVNAPPEYRQALQSLAAGQFEQASQQLDAFLKANPASPWTQAATLNSGRALEGLEEWSDASERYHSVVRATPEAKKLQAMALYRLSVCEEALGDDQQVVAVLNDLLPRSSELPPETAAAELPARLASAYARVGNFDRALDFYRKAENGIAKLRQAAGDKVPEWLPRTLFDMGAMSRHKPAWDEFEISLRPLARGQVYLLQAAELQVEPWATQAADEIIATYNSLWNVVASAAPERGGDPVLAKRALQLRQWDRAILLLDNLAELRARALPPEAAAMGPSAQKILSAGEALEKKIALLLLERPAGEGLTREALSRQQGVQGITLTPSDELERRFLESGREAPPIVKSQRHHAKVLPKKKVEEPQTAAVPVPSPAPVASPAPPAEPVKPPAEDPNL